jgi:carnitine 3-dehydrogenase
LNVTVYDKFPQAESGLKQVLATSEASLMRICPFRQISVERSFTTDLAHAVGGADYVQECAPEKLELKRSILPKSNVTQWENVMIAPPRPV